MESILVWFKGHQVVALEDSEVARRALGRADRLLAQLARVVALVVSCCQQWEPALR